VRILSLLVVILCLISVGFLFAYIPAERVNVRATLGNESGYPSDNPPPIDSLCLVFSGIDYGASASSPQNYVNAKHIANVNVGSYYFPVVTWETGDPYNLQSYFSYWDDLFKFWSYPDSFTSNQGQDTGRPSIAADSHGNLHFCWHQAGSPDGYEVFYTRAILDTSSGVIQYNVERPAQFISETNGEEEEFPVLTIYEDTLIMVVWNVGPLHSEHAFGYNYSTDGGTTWVGDGIVYENTDPFPCNAWMFPCIAPDPNNGDMWAIWPWDYSGDGYQDVAAYHWDAATNTWSNELAAECPGTDGHPYALPAIVVDYNSNPHIILQENLITDGGSSGSLSGYGSDPCGTLYHTQKSGGSWSSPEKILFPRWTPCNYATGHPSAGITTDNRIYFSAVQPESANPDTSVYGAFNVHYARIEPSGDVSYGGKVSELGLGETLWAIFAHTTYHVPLGGEVPAGSQGPGITWCQMEGSAPPANVYYKHCDTIPLGIEETADVPSQSYTTLYQNYPNPAYEKTMIRFTIPDNRNVKLDIYDISGRLVRTLANGIPGAGSYFCVWDGKDASGKAVPGGVYLYTLKVGSYTQTRKLLLIP
jgi:hypothetical protein